MFFSYVDRTVVFKLVHLISRKISWHTDSKYPTSTIYDYFWQVINALKQHWSGVTDVIDALSTTDSHIRKQCSGIFEYTMIEIYVKHQPRT